MSLANSVSFRREHTANANDTNAFKDVNNSGFDKKDESIIVFKDFEQCNQVVPNTPSENLFSVEDMQKADEISQFQQEIEKLFESRSRMTD